MAKLQVTVLPKNPELLWLQTQQSHRSYKVFTLPDQYDEAVTCRRCDGRLWDYLKKHNYGVIPGNVLTHVRNAGFAGLFEIGYRQLDHPLITALVERWRPETHTFHLPIGEVTVTLEDVQILFGLPIDGPPVTGVWYRRSKPEWVDRCEELLGYRPSERHIEGGALRITSLTSQLHHPIEENENGFQKRARVFILALLGGTLFPDSSQKTVPLNYLEMIADLSSEGRHSWGSAVLAYLYRNLCAAATNPEGKSIEGCLTLLMFWVWARIPVIAPKIKVGHNDPYNYDEVYAARWSYELSYSETISHSLVGFRSIFNTLEPIQFVWRPYQNILQLLPEGCREGQHLWGYQRFIIFFEVVELHLPERVARQLGFVQQIPPSGSLILQDEHELLHSLTRSGRRVVNWRDTHLVPYVENWLNRNNSIFQGEHMTEQRTRHPNYMRWYFERTVLLVTNPGRQPPHNQYPDFGARQQLYQQGLMHLQNVCEMESQRNPEHSEVFRNIAEIPTQLMQYGKVLSTSTQGLLARPNMDK